MSIISAGAALRRTEEFLGSVWGAAEIGPAEEVRTPPVRRAGEVITVGSVGERYVLRGEGAARYLEPLRR